jgi:hypothetical protein
MAISPEAPARTSEPEASSLKRAISRNMLLVLVLGDVLGAGIYALVGEVGGRVGDVIWSAFLLALALAIFTAFAYAELVTKYPQAAQTSRDPLGSRSAAAAGRSRVVLWCPGACGSGPRGHCARPPFPATPLP